MLVFVIAEIACGVLIYNQQGAFQEKVHYSILKAVDRHYGNDITNTTKLDLIQEGVSIYTLYYLKTDNIIS